MSNRNRAAAGRRGWLALAVVAMAALAAQCSGTVRPGAAGRLGQPCIQGACNPPLLCDGGTQVCVSPTCGNGVVDAGEQCDGPALAGQTCVSLGLAGSGLACKPNCTFDTSACSTCGNGVVDAGEQCDGSNLAGQTCATLGYSGGSLACKANCSFDTSACTAVGGPGVPTLVQNVSSSTNPVGKGIPGNNFKFNMPNPVLPGNALVLKVAYPTASFAATPITDSRGNAWPATPTAASSGSNLKMAVFVLPNASLGLTEITIHFTSSILAVQYDCSEWAGVDTMAPLNGSSHASAPGSGIAAGSFTPGNNDANGGNLVIQYAVDDDGPGSGPSVSLFTAGSGYQLLDADVTWGTDANSYHASQYFVQTSAAPVDPTMTASAATAQFNTLAVALKAASAGTLPAASGIRIVKVHHFTNETPAGKTLRVQFPTAGSSLVVFATANAPADASTTITGFTDNKGNTYAKTEPADDQPQWWIAQGAATDATLLITFQVLAGSAGMSMRLFEISGAATSGQPDSSAGKSATDCSNQSAISGHPIITPASANGLTIATMAIGQGPGLSVTSPAGAVWGLVTYAGERDTDTMENADAVGWLYNATTATENWSWTLTPIPGNTCYSSAIHLKGG